MPAVPDQDILMSVEGLKQTLKLAEGDGWAHTLKLVFEGSQCGFSGRVSEYHTQLILCIAGARDRAKGGEGKRAHDRRY